jgi:hypothetical protein
MWQVMQVANAARTEIVLSTDGPSAGDAGMDEDEDAMLERNLAGPSKDAVDKFEQHGEYAGGRLRQSSG